MKKIILLVVFTLTISFQTLVQAEKSTSVGNFVVHYNAISTQSLPPKVARAYGITRSNNKGLLNISVLKKGAGYQGVEAKIDVTATNLTGQLRDVTLRKITEQSAIYYISVFSVADQETLDFSIKVTTTDGNSTNIKLRQQFFAN